MDDTTSNSAESMRPAGAKVRAARPKRRHSMMLSVLAVLLVVGLVPVALMGYRVATDLESDLSANQKETQLTLSETVAEEIVAHVDGNFRRLEVVADALSLLGGAAGATPGATASEPAVRRFLEQVLLREGALDLRLVSAEPGAAVLDVHSPSFDPEAAREQLEPAMEEAVSRSRRGLTHLSRPFLPENASLPQMLAVLSVPLRAADGRGDPGGAGVLAAVVSLSPLQGVVQRAGNAASGSRVYVLDDELRPVAHTQYLEVVQRADHSKSRLAHEFQRVGLGSAASLVFREAAGDGVPREVIGTYRPVGVQGRVWGVFVEVDSDIGLIQVREMRRTTLTWGLLAFVLALVLGFAFTLKITRPVHELTESTRRIALGEYGKRVRVSSNDEIGMLADNFNLMSGSIRRTIDELQRQHELNEQLFMSAIRSLAAAIDARDPYTRGHSERVTRYSRIIARQLELPPDQVRNIEIGALLHDVGKIGIEDRILRKPSALTPEEFEIMKTHPEKGGTIMEPIATLREATEVIIHHHERWDGTGYPSGLKGEEIPLGARVVAVADTFDAMTTNRPYQRAMTFSVAAQKIQTFATKAADPRVVQAFVAALDQGLFGQVDTRPRVSEG